MIGKTNTAVSSSFFNRIEGHSISKNSLQYPYSDNCLEVAVPLVVVLTLVKWHQRLVVHPGQTSNSSLVWKRADVFKINDDDELFDERSCWLPDQPPLDAITTRWKWWSVILFSSSGPQSMMQYIITLYWLVFLKQFFGSCKLNL